MRLTTILLNSLLITSTLAGCGLKSAFDMGTTTPVNQNQICNRLKRDIIFYSVDQNHDTAWSSPAKQADILRQYRDNNCDQVLNGNSEANSADSTPFSVPGSNAKNQDKITVRTQR
jgi:hypothetical protein